MKKLLLILAAILSVSAVSAQNRGDNRHDRDHYPPTQTSGNWNNGNDRDRWKDRGYNNRRNDRYDRQAEYDRMNEQYDRRIDDYRRDRAMSSYERQRRIDEAERERQEKAKSFGKGLVVGGIAAVIIGAILSH